MESDSAVLLFMSVVANMRASERGYLGDSQLATLAAPALGRGA
jgi:hypothetical protein